jgi:ribosomal protein S28E/S33
VASDLTVGLDMIAAATVPTKPAARLLWGVVTSTASPVQVVLENDTSATSRPVSGNAAGPVMVGDRVLLARQRRRLTIVANPTAQVRMTADTGWVSSGVASGSAGVTVSSQTFRRVGRVVSFDLLLVATVATTVPTSGDIGNSIYVVNLASGWYPTAGPTQGVGSNGASGRVLSGGVTTSGQMHVGAVGGAGTIAVGDLLRLAGTYIV